MNHRTQLFVLHYGVRGTLGRSYGRKERPHLREPSLVSEGAVPLRMPRHLKAYWNTTTGSLVQMYA